MAKCLCAIIIILIYACILLLIRIDGLNFRNKILFDRVVSDSTIMGIYEARLDLFAFKEIKYYMLCSFEDKASITEKYYNELPVKYQYYAGEFDKPFHEALCKGYNNEIQSIKKNNPPEIINKLLHPQTNSSIQQKAPDDKAK